MLNSLAKKFIQVVWKRDNHNEYNKNLSWEELKVLSLKNEFQTKIWIFSSYQDQRISSFWSLNIPVDILFIDMSKSKLIFQQKFPRTGVTFYLKWYSFSPLVWSWVFFISDGLCTVWSWSCAEFAMEQSQKPHLLQNNSLHTGVVVLQSGWQPSGLSSSRLIKFGLHWSQWCPVTCFLQ